MRAIVHTGAGDISVLRVAEVPTPTPGDRQIQVRVQASGLNRADILQRKGRYPAPPGWPAEIPGLEYAGEVTVLGPGVSRWKIGDRVMGLVGGGAQAEFLVVHEDEAMAVPEGLRLTDAAAIPEAFLTAWDALVTRGRLVAGQRVLIHAVGSGVGTAAVQLARQLGAIPDGTSRNPSKLARAKEVGLAEGIETGGGLALKDSLAPGSRQGAPVGGSVAVGRLGGSVYNLIIDVLGGPALAANLEALAPLGRLVMLGFLQGPKADLSLEPILRKRLTIVGSVMRTRRLEERIPLVAEFSARVLPWFAAGQIRPIIATTYPMTEIAAAHAEMERDENFGKIVLRW